jgi:hypothetical protein
MNAVIRTRSSPTQDVHAVQVEADGLSRALLQGFFDRALPATGTDREISSHGALKGVRRAETSPHLPARDISVLASRFRNFIGGLREAWEPRHAD